MKNAVVNKIEKAIEDKILKAIEDNNFTYGGENYIENTLMIWGTGGWVTTHCNEYGSRYGSMKRGHVDLTAVESEYLNSIPGKHIVFDY